MFRQEEVGQNSFVAIGGVVGDPFPSPILRCLVHRFHVRVQVGLVVGVKRLVDIEDLVGNRLLLSVIPRQVFDGAGERLGGDPPIFFMSLIPYVGRRSKGDWASPSTNM